MNRRPSPEAQTDEWTQGYLDGHDLSEPEPGPNRDPRYVHSFRVARAEKAGTPIPSDVSRRRIAEIEAMFSEDRQS